MINIHKEGYRTIMIVAALIAVIIIALKLLDSTIARAPIFYVALLVVFIAIVQFFRNPSRDIKVDKNAILCPADGKVVVVEETTEQEFFKQPMIQVSIFMSPLNVHVNRYPVSGKVLYEKHHPGKYLVAWNPKSSHLNERTSIALENESGKKILLHQVAGFLARRIVCYASKDQKVTQGTELGFIKFGSRVDLYLPLNSEVKVKIGDIVKGGITQIANFG